MVRTRKAASGAGEVSWTVALAAVMESALPR